WYEFQPDFGSEFTLNFVCGNLVGTDNNSIEESFANIHVYPNITHDISKIYMTGMFGNTIISTLDANGRIVRNEEIYLLSGEENTTLIDLENEPAGFYFVKITNRQVVRTFKIIKM
ncbi:MAG TPA: T9SS type A sorting domain-containing protein, partial [Saprospiraceae bacterium]|nr:T9SS type A sorting domain-containing protein [Saprospiraceae bacterium]